MMYINPTPADYDQRLLLEASDEARPLLLLAIHFLFFVCTRNAVDANNDRRCLSWAWYHRP